MSRTIMQCGGLTFDPTQIVAAQIALDAHIQLVTAGGASLIERYTEQNPPSNECLEALDRVVAMKGDAWTAYESATGDRTWLDHSRITAIEQIDEAACKVVDFGGGKLIVHIPADSMAREIFGPQPDAIAA